MNKYGNVLQISSWVIYWWSSIYWDNVQQQNRKKERKKIPVNIIPSSMRLKPPKNNKPFIKIH